MGMASFFYVGDDLHNRPPVPAKQNRLLIALYLCNQRRQPCLRLMNIHSLHIIYLSVNSLAKLD